MKKVTPENFLDYTHTCTHTHTHAHTHIYTHIHIHTHTHTRTHIHTHIHIHTPELAKVELLKINGEEINKDTDMISMVKKKELFDF